jgi:hypothetical protein
LTEAGAARPRPSGGTDTNSLDSRSNRLTVVAVMTLRIPRFAFFFAVATLAFAAEDTPKPNMKEVLRARIAEDAKKSEAKKTAPAANAVKSGAGTPSDAGGHDATPGSKPMPAAKAEEKAAKETAPTVLPKVEVKKSRITELDQTLARQEQEIARERKNLKASEVDSALNDSKIAKPLAIFGGESTQFRQRVASERVELMEAEKDVIEAIARAKSKEEKQLLQKQLDELKAVRRELEKSLR